MSAERVVVLGAGPAGLVVADRLVRRGVPCVVVEAASSVGGLSRSLRLWGRTVDLGPHSFYSTGQPEAVRRWSDLTRGEIDASVPRRAAWWRGGLMSFPPGPLDVARRAGAVGACRLAASRAVRRRAVAGTDAASVLGVQYGKVAVSELFDPYCRKFLGLPADQVDADFVAGLLATRDGVHAPVRLLTPRNGTGSVWDGLAESLRDRGAEILLGRRVVGLEGSDTWLQSVRLDDGCLPCAAVVSSLPLDLLARMLPGSPRAQRHTSLRSRDTLLVYVLVRGGGLGRHYVTVYDGSYRTGRITDYRAYYPTLYAGDDHSVLGVELWSSGDDDLAVMSDEALARTAIAELVAMGMVPRAAIRDTSVVRLPRSVPVLAHGYAAALASAQRSVEPLANLRVVGRHGRFRWDGQEENLVAGAAIADAVADALMAGSGRGRGAG